MHNYHYCTPERRGYWSRLSAIHEKHVVVRLESALTSDLKTAENYGSDYGVENGATFRSNHDSFPKTEIKGNSHRCSNSIRVNTTAS